MQVVAKGHSAQYSLYIQWLQDHFLANYNLSLAAVMKALTTRLPVGQDANQIETVMLRSNHATGEQIWYLAEPRNIVKSLCVK